MSTYIINKCIFENLTIYLQPGCNKSFTLNYSTSTLVTRALLYCNKNSLTSMVNDFYKKIIKKYNFETSLPREWKYFKLDIKISSSILVKSFVEFYVLKQTLLKKF